jgi:hypothetical protein
MKTNTSAPNYKGFRFPAEIISHAVWLYFRFSLSFRDIEELLAQRGIVVTYESVRQMRRFKSARHAQRFLSAFGPTYEHFKLRLHCMNAQDYRATLRSRFQVWNGITEIKLAA